MKISTRFAIAATLLSTSATASTALTGTYVGDYQFEVINSSHQVKANSLNSYTWRWDFDNQELRINNGQIFKTPHRFLRFDYQAQGAKAIPLTNNGDGTYTANYVFKVQYPFFYNPKANASTTFKITKVGSNIRIETVDIEANGAPDGSPGTLMQGEFPHEIQLNWFGQASLFNPQWNNLSPADLLK